ncbi:DNA repair RAD52-like protein 2, chloroplastic [Heracleum sosnowskyi]|uniref:DNA repair RAD52-like protein 2, chloroplastic n=1 Tax=Heracleum sosnowskyi TaxID=360622 RepID=A0AAD8M9F4_9APIA|nr:DNA repair RAD52-like protein 2, chloroplastic [Heracleum sosnowskyi]
MAVQSGWSFLQQSVIPVRFEQLRRQSQRHMCLSFSTSDNTRRDWMRALAIGSGGDPPGAVPNSNYVVPMDSNSPSCITRPLAEILRDLNKRIPDNIIIKTDDHINTSAPFIPWYHANRMLSFYAPGWCGEIRDVIFSDSGSVTVVYRVTVRGLDGEAYRESTGTVSSGNDHVDPVAAAEELAFCRACARFGLGLYLYHED